MNSERARQDNRSDSSSETIITLEMREGESQ
jgi:hypothetical protein